MIEQRYCNYQRNYQQRLGFLKLVSWVGEGVRGGPEEILSRMNELSADRSRRRGNFPYNHLDPTVLLNRREIPSWQPGFVPKVYDRLVQWAQMVGIIGPTGRLSEWANILNALSPNRNLRDFNACNPFELSRGERDFFVHLLFYHDQVLPILLEFLGHLPPDSRIGVSESCRYVVLALGKFLDNLRQKGPEGLKMRVALRDTLEKTAHEYGLPDKHSLVNPKLRVAAFDSLAEGRRRGSRVLHAERQAVCRFEQLTDLGILVKDNPANPPDSEEEMKSARSESWTWYTTTRLPAAADVIRACGGDLEQFLRKQWIRFCAVGLPGPGERQPRPTTDLSELARFLDRALPIVRRQIGPIQVHPWATLACILAAEAGAQFEVDHVHGLLAKLHADPRTSSAIRLGGTESFRGRNVVVPTEGLTSLVQEFSESENA
jgi:hypothetical protein